MGEKPNVGMIERVKGFIKSKPILPSDQVDQYITGNLPRYIKEYKLAMRSDLDDIDKKVERFVEEADELNEWKKKTEIRLDNVRNKVKRLEKLYGLEER